MDGSKYVKFEDRDSRLTVVYFTKDLSAKGLIKVYDEICCALYGRVAVKLHTGEKNGPNIIPREWVKELFEKRLENAKIVETNAYYHGDRDTTEKHRETLKTNGWTFAPVDILDEEGETYFQVPGGKRIQQISVGSHMLNYDSMLVLTHFKGHAMAGFGGSNKNIGIGCATGKHGKAQIHTTPNQDNQWDIVEEELMERITESTKGTINYFGEQIAYINIMRNMSVSCDCEGTAAEPVVTPNVGILGSFDILAIDQASVDLIYAMEPKYRKALVERIESRHGLRQLSYMKEMDMGQDRYILINLDTPKFSTISVEDAVKDLVPFTE